MGIQVSYDISVFSLQLGNPTKAARGRYSCSNTCHYNFSYCEPWVPDYSSDLSVSTLQAQITPQIKPWSHPTKPISESLFLSILSHIQPNQLVLAPPPIRPIHHPCSPSPHSHYLDPSLPSLSSHKDAPPTAAISTLLQDPSHRALR